MIANADSLANRYSHIDISDLRAIVEAPEGEYLPEAREAARAELAKRGLDQPPGEPAIVPEVPAAPRYRARGFFAICLILKGETLITPALFGILSLPLGPSWSLVLWSMLSLFVGGMLTYMASVIDPAFWSHVVKVYAITGFLEAGFALCDLAMGRSGVEHSRTKILQDSLAIVLALAVWVWRRGKERASSDASI
jgi:hypothetical protein